MKKNIFSLITSTVLLFVAIACTNVLDQNAVDAINEQSIFMDINLTKAYLGNCYDLMDGTGGTGENDVALGLSKDLLSSLSDESVLSFRPKNAAMFKGNLSGDFLGYLGNNFYRYLHWGPLYADIKNVNVLLAHIDKVPVSDATIALRDRIKGEAYFIRAYVYMKLMQTYGGVILIDKPFEIGDDYLSIKRSSLDKTVAFILADADKAIALLPTKDKIEQGRATKGAAAALKSRVLSWSTGILMNGGYEVSDSLITFKQGTRTDRLKAAKQMAKDIMDGKYGHYALTGTTNDPPATMTDEAVKQYAKILTGIFNQTGNWDDEVIWGVMLNKEAGKQAAQNKWWGPNGYHNWGNNGPTEEAVRMFEMKDGTPFVWDKYNPGNMNVRDFTAAQLAANPERNPYVGREPRFYAWVLYDGAQWQTRPPDGLARDPESKVQTGYNVDAAGKTTQVGLDTPQSDIEGWNSSKTGYYLKKYMNESVMGMYSLNEDAWIEFRYAEVIMDFAEACIELGDVQEGLDAVNLVRNRAGLPDRVTTLQAKARDWYRIERQHEFFGEGDRYYMIRKWMIAQDVIKDTYHMVIKHYPDGRTSWTNDTKAKVDARSWQRAAYWNPIPKVEINKAPQLQQTPGF